MNSAKLLTAPKTEIAKKPASSNLESEDYFLKRMIIASYLNKQTQGFLPLLKPHQPNLHKFQPNLTGPSILQDPKNTQE